MVYTGLYTIYILCQHTNIYQYLSGIRAHRISASNMPTELMAPAIGRLRGSPGARCGRPSILHTVAGRQRSVGCNKRYVYERRWLLLTCIRLAGDAYADQYGEKGEEEHQQHGHEHAPRIGGLRPGHVRAEAGRALPEVLRDIECICILCSICMIINV